jgi:integrase
MMRVVPEPGRTMIGTAWFTSLRRSEIRGLEWENYSGTVLQVKRSIVEGKIQECKSKASKAPVSVSTSHTRLLDEHRQRDGNPQTGPIFRTAIGTALDPNNVLNRQILPALDRCAVCRRPKVEHTAKVAHQFDYSWLAWLARIPARIGDGVARSRD